MAGVPSPTQALRIARIAAVDLSARQYEFVILNGSNQAALPAAAGDEAIGVLQNAPVAGELADIVIQGPTKLRAGAAFNPQTKLMAGGTGNSRGITAVATEQVLATALEAGVDGQIIAAEMSREGVL